MITPAEQEVLDSLADAWNKYIRLQEQHPEDRTEFMRAIHVAQNIVLARPTCREMNLVIKKDGGK